MTISLDQEQHSRNYIVMYSMFGSIIFLACLYFLKHNVYTKSSGIILKYSPVFLSAIERKNFYSILKLGPLLDQTFRFSLLALRAELVAHYYGSELPNVSPTHTHKFTIPNICTQTYTVPEMFYKTKQWIQDSVANGSVASDLVNNSFSLYLRSHSQIPAAR